MINAQPLAASVASVSDSPARGGEAGKSASSGVTEKNPILAHAERLYTQTSAAVEKRYTEDKCGLEHGAKNVSMAITAEALAKGMDRIDQVLLINSAKPQDRHFLAIQGREIESGFRINVLEAQQKPVAESLAQIHETVQSQSQSLNHTPNLNPSESSAKLAQNNTAQTSDDHQQQQLDFGPAAHEIQAQQASQSLRQVYRQLVGALHPDRELDLDKKEEKTEWMKQINLAYEQSDLLTLLPLQLECEHITQIQSQVDHIKARFVSFLDWPARRELLPDMLVK